MLFLVAEIASVAVSTVRPGSAQAAPAPPGQGFTVTPGDLHFILKQIQIAEHHAATQTPTNMCGTLVGPDANQIPDRLTSYGLRTVDGSCNNLFPGRETFAAADQKFPRLTDPVFRAGEDAGPFGPPGPTSYANANGNVVDSQPRTISNLIVDQTSTNPAAVAAAAFPVRTQGNPGLFPCKTDPAPDGTGGDPVGCVPSHKTLFIPNVTTDVGLSPPYNSMFTFFGQFFDHGVDQTVKSGKAVFVPLKPDDPLITLGPDGKPNTNDEVTDPHQQFMVLTRAQNQPGPDGKLGTADDIQDATNTDSPWVDQSQTYTSHPSHQVFLREYVNDTNGKPVSTGKLLGGLAAGDTYLNSPDGRTGMATWASVKKQAHDVLGLRLVDRDVTNIPMIASDPYGKFIPGPARGLPQYVTESGLVEGQLDDSTTPNVDETIPVPENVKHFDTPFLTDIAHNADPSPQDPDNNPTTPLVVPTPDDDKSPSADFAHQPAGTYDDEMLNAHFAAGDGRVNENIALTTIHQIFHSEHDRLVADMNKTLTDPGADGQLGTADDKPNTGVSQADFDAWHKVETAAAGGYNYGERLFQAARFVTEMEYQHLVFEEFARKVQPAIRPFHLYHSDINAAIPAEFAHAVYRFGHSMLDDTVARKTVDPNGTAHDNSLPLLTAFLNPPEFFNSSQTDPTATKYTPEQAAGSVIMGSSDQVGNELDEFVTETLRNNLLGLPLDLPTINMARAREAGVPPLNNLRRQIFAATNDSAMAPYTDWSDFGQHLKHPESLINFVAAYGKHSRITEATTLAAKRAAAKAIVDPANPADAPPDAADFMFSTGAWATKPTGLDDVDLWVGGLAELTNLGGGLLGSTFNYVFQNTLENLQDGDRLYYLARTPGMNLRTQLEGNSFAEMIQRNTEGTHSLKADAFATADCKFQLGTITFPYDPLKSAPPAADDPAPVTGAGSVNDVAATDCNENLLLLRKPDGTIQYRSFNKVDPSGINGQSVYKGTPGPDRIFGGIDNDTFWGDDGKDVIEGNNGDDVALGGDGNDIITDLNGADTLKGGPGNDAIDGGPGDDLPMGGDGSDFLNGGANDNESFAGEGNDFIIAGQGADAVFGDGGDDWIEGGSGQDLLQGDHSAPFFDDPAEIKPGNDVFVGQVGENDYDAEGGDDVMSQNSAIDRNAGAAGFDWAFHQYDTVGADDDMAINNNLGNGLPVVVNRDRWQETEADSGSKFNDIIRGDSDTPTAVGGAGFTGCDALDQTGVNRISGLDPLVPPLTVPVADVGHALGVVCSALSGTVWGDGNILLGGAGGDTIEGRGGNDIIDGDQALRVRLSVRTNPADPATEVGTTDLMEGKPLALPNLTPLPTGSFGPGTAGMTLQQAVFAGLVDPGNIVAVREIVNETTPAGTVDTAVFSGASNEYTFRQDGSTLEVTHSGGAATDGVDRLTNIEKLQFTDVTLNNGVGVTVTPSLAFGSRAVNTAPAITQPVTITNNGLSSITLSSIAPLINQVPATPAQFSTPALTALPAATCRPIPAGGTCTIPVTFRPTATGAKSATLHITSTNIPGGFVDVPLTGTGVTNRAATGTPTITGNSPAGQTVTGQTLTVGNLAAIGDLDGPGPFTVSWQVALTNVFAAPTTRATGNSYVVRATDRGLFIRAVVTFTDTFGTPESRPSASVRFPLLAAAAASVAAAQPTATPLGQALAPQIRPASVAPAVVTRAGTTLAVSSSRSGLTVATAVPSGTRAVQISLFSLHTLDKRTSVGAKRGMRHVATVFRKTTAAKRYVFRLTGKRFRHLKPGRYLIQVRVGPSRTALGAPVTREITVKRSQSKSAR